MGANSRHPAAVDRLVDEPRRGLLGRLAGLLSSEETDADDPRPRWLSAGDPAARLERYLRRSKVVVLHHRRVPGEGAAISHLIVGPAGVTVVDSHRYAGPRVKLENGRLKIGLRDRSDLIDGVLAQVQSVREILADTPYAEVPVEAALARRKVEGVPVIRKRNSPRLVVCGTRRIAGEASRPGPLTTRRVNALAAYLERALPPV
jgi:hypothetical protein